MEMAGANFAFARRPREGEDPSFLLLRWAPASAGDAQKHCLRHYSLREHDALRDIHGCACDVA